MGRGGGRSGGGGMSRGGSRGFSSSRSSSGSSRGGSSFGGSSGRSASSPGRSPSHRTKTAGTVFRPTTVFIGSGRRNSTYGGGTSGGQQKPYPPKKKRGIPGWYKFLCIVMTLVVIFLLFSAVHARNAAADTVTREKLGAEACISTDQVIDDQLGWLTDKGTVRSAISYFYDKTGVQPYLLLCDNLNGKGGEITDAEAESFLEELYDSLYSDEGHMIFVFMEYESSEYVTFLYTGRSADSVMDADARGIFLDNADRYYTDSSLSDEEYFAKIFRASADTIMEDAAGNARSALIYVVLSVVILVVMAAGLILFKSAEQKRREAEEMRKILETPVGGTGYSPEEEELINKYSDENQGGNN
ncbi:MAG: hypothetical protein ACI4LA_00215 [Emergencia sp.]